MSLQQVAAVLFLYVCLSVCIFIRASELFLMIVFVLYSKLLIAKVSRARRAIALPVVCLDAIFYYYVSIILYSCLQKNNQMHGQTASANADLRDN